VSDPAALAAEIRRHEALYRAGTPEIPDSAFDELVRRYQDRIYTLCLRWMRSPSLAEETAQDVFFAAWRAAGSFRGGASARGWLFTIARNAVRHLQRRRVDEPATLESLEVLAERGGWGAPATAEEEAAINARALVAAAFARLPAGEREVLSLRELDGLSGEETAALLGVSLPAMKSRLHRARLHLAAVVRELEPPMASHSGGTHAR
jgi:RNA polymerase sigma-70 factor (ECF subfamily)